MRDNWQSGDFWIMYAARNNFALDTIYWQKIDQRFFGSTCEYENICDVWRKRLHLLEPEEIELMEEYVDLKVKERDIIFAWDPDEYTVEWIKRMRAMRKTKDMKQKMERVVKEWEEELDRMTKMESKGEIKRMEMGWKEVIKDMKEMKRRTAAEWEEEIERMMKMEKKEEIE